MTAGRGLLAAACSLTLALSGCDGCGPLPQLPALPFDAGSFVDAGSSTGDDAGGLFDAGQKPPSDGGYVPANYPTDFPLEDCGPDVAFTDEADAAVSFPICIALGWFDGQARVNGAPPTAPLSLSLQGERAYGSLTVTADSDGGFRGGAMRSEYYGSSFRPQQVGVSHGGSVPSGRMDLRTRAFFDAGVDIFTLSGHVRYGGEVPSPANGEDVSLIGQGTPGFQHQRVKSKAGNYSAKFYAGQFDVTLQLPQTALGDVELRGFTGGVVNLDGDRRLDFTVPAVPISGNVLIDGRSFPDRISGDDYELLYEDAVTGAQLASSSHSSEARAFSSRVPPGTYNLVFQSFANSDPSLPAQIVNKRIASQVVLDGGLSGLQLELHTVTREGSIAFDGQAVEANPGRRWYLYTVAEAEGDQPWFVSYYFSELLAPSFGLKFFPANYYMLFYVSPTFGEEFAEGWTLLSPSMDVHDAGTLPIDIATSTVSGRLFIDGAPATGGWVGTLAFSSNKGTFYKTVYTQDGNFSARMPKGTYSVSFVPDRRAYPLHAIGRTVLATGVDLSDSRTVELRYDTKLVSGPLRVQGEAPDDSLPSAHEYELVLERHTGDVFGAPIQGGDHFRLRVPPGRYRTRFRIYPGALENVATGEALLGKELVVP